MVGITTGPPIWGYLKEGNGLPGEVCSGEVRWKMIPVHWSGTEPLVNNIDDYAPNVFQKAANVLVIGFYHW
jgi:hypothetical protein